MSFEVDRCSAAWAHIALCADLTWTIEPPDDFILANQRLLAQHCRITKVLQEAAEVQNTYTQTNNQCVLIGQTRENGGTCGRRSVKDVIPESRLAQFYGNFYYDDVREKCYTNPSVRTNGRGYSGQGENSDLTECWMLPEVEYWFRRLLDESQEQGVSRRRRQYRILPDDDFERWDPARAQGDEATLAARVQSVRPLWSSPPTSSTSRNPQKTRIQKTRAPSPPPTPRKIRARRRQPRRLATPSSPAYCLEMPAQLFCDPKRKFQFETSRLPRSADCQRAPDTSRTSVQVATRAPKRCLPYRGTNVCRYAPTGQRPARSTWWFRDQQSYKIAEKFNKFQLEHSKPQENTKNDEKPASEVKIVEKSNNRPPATPKEAEQKQVEDNEESPKVAELTADDAQQPCTSATPDTSVRKKRLYSTVLSTSSPSAINLTPSSVKLSQKLATPGLIKLSSKILMTSTRLRSANVDIKFEELEKEALEQYKASDESIDTKFRELEKQAEEQYSASNSNTSCSSGNSAEKENTNFTVLDEGNNKTAKFYKDKSVNSVVIYSQNFPDLNGKSKSNNLKNFHTPRRGEKKEITHRLSKQRNTKSDSQRAASDTDYEAREKKHHKGMTRWTLPKKRHLTFCVSDISSDEDMDNTTGTIKDAGPRVKNHASGKAKMSAHGGGDLQPVMRKTS